MTNEEPKVADAGRYTMTETCKVLGIHRNTLRRWLQAGKIKVKFRRIDNRKVFEGSEIKKSGGLPYDECLRKSEAADRQVGAGAKGQQATGNHEGSGKTHSGKGVRQHALSFTGRSSGAPDERVQQADACGRTSDIL